MQAREGSHDGMGREYRDCYDEFNDSGSRYPPGKRRWAGCETTQESRAAFDVSSYTQSVAAILGREREPVEYFSSAVHSIDHAAPATHLQSHDVVFVYPVVGEAVVQAVRLRRI